MDSVDAQISAVADSNSESVPMAVRRTIPNTALCRRLQMRTDGRRSVSGGSICDKEQSPMSPMSRGRTLRRSLGTAGLSGLVAAGLFVSIGTAEAATLFSSDFESGSTGGWSKSGGTWSVVSDGTQALQ
jgi:hypothetical protein